MSAVSNESEKKIIEVKWKNGSRFSIDPEVAKREIDKIKAKKGGEVFASDIVDAAKSKRSPLHREFEWDDTKAASLYRCEQARLMLRSIEVVYKEMPSTPVRSYNVVTSATSNEETGKKKCYKSTEDILSDPELRMELLSTAFAELRRFQRRFHGLQELSIVFRAINEALEKISVG